MLQEDEAGASEVGLSLAPCLCSMCTLCVNNFAVEKIKTITVATE